MLEAVLLQRVLRKCFCSHPHISRLCWHLLEAGLYLHKKMLITASGGLLILKGNTLTSFGLSPYQGWYYAMSSL